jgi:hypothetical protein
LARLARQGAGGGLDVDGLEHEHLRALGDRRLGLLLRLAGSWSALA